MQNAGKEGAPITETNTALAAGGAAALGLAASGIGLGYFNFSAIDELRGIADEAGIRQQKIEEESKKQEEERKKQEEEHLEAMIATVSAFPLLEGLSYPASLDGYNGPYGNDVIPGVDSLDSSAYSDPYGNDGISGVTPFNSSGYSDSYGNDDISGGNFSGF